MKKLKVYVASGYTDGGKITDGRQKLENALTSLKVSDDLINLGFAPFTPLLNHWQDQIYPQPGKVWLELDFEWLPVCDCVLRIKNGESDGASQEEELANKLGIPIFYNLGDLKMWSEKRRIQEEHFDVENIKDNIEVLQRILDNMKRGI